VHGLGTGLPYSIPLGGMIEYTGTTAPNSCFVLPFGQAISRTTYATYFALVGTTYGSGDGSTTFNVIDKRGYVSAGKGDMGGSAGGGNFGTVSTDNGTIICTTLGSKGGTATHILTSAEIPAHSHTISDPGHTHTGIQGTSNSGAQSHGYPVIGNALNNFNSDSAIITSNSTGITGTNANTGGGNAHALLQPTIIVNYVLRVM
jgi:microcystin-dependent protein